MGAVRPIHPVVMKELRLGVRPRDDMHTRGGDLRQAPSSSLGASHRGTLPARRRDDTRNRPSAHGSRSRPW
jgi:hypothetical protein